MRLPHHPVGLRLGLLQPGVPRHEEEERKVEEGADLPDDGSPFRNGQRAEVAEDEEHHDEERERGLRELALVAYRLHRALVEPGKEEKDERRAAHQDHTPHLRIENDLVRALHEEYEHRAYERRRELESER